MSTDATCGPLFIGFVSECRPAILFGEQVAGTLGREWFAGVRADLDAGGHACGAGNLPAAGAGAPHIRQRIWWFGVLVDIGGRRLGGRRKPKRRRARDAARAGAASRLADGDGAVGRRSAGERREGAGATAAGPSHEPRRRSRPGNRVADADRDRGTRGALKIENLHGRSTITLTTQAHYVLGGWATPSERDHRSEEGTDEWKAEQMAHARGSR